MKHSPFPRNRRKSCLWIESIPWLLPLAYAAVRWGLSLLPDSRLPEALPIPLLSAVCAMLVDWLLSPLRLGRRIWYYRLAAERDPRGSFRYAFRHAGRAYGWRFCLCLCRSALLAALLLPLRLSGRLAAQLRTLSASPAVDLALLSCHLAAAAALLLLLPLAVWLLLSLWPLAEMRTDSGSLFCALSRSFRLLHRRRGEALLVRLRESWRLLLFPVPVIGLLASAKRQWRLSCWIRQRETAVLPPMQEGVRLFIPHSGRKISSPPL